MIFGKRFIPLLFLCFPAGVWAQETHRSVVAERGDGVHSLLRKHGLNPSVHAPLFYELNRHRMGPDDYLLEGVRYILPERSEEMGITDDPDTIEFPLFGETYSTVTIKDRRLEGAVYYLIAGHGGPDPGAISRYGGHPISEHEYAYDVTLRLARRLMEHGADIYMIVRDPENGIRDDRILSIDSNEVVYPNRPIPLNQLARLQQRTDVVNELWLKNRGAYQRLIEIHLDSRAEGQNIDVFFYHHHNSQNGKNLAESIHQTFLQKYGIHQPGRRYHGTVSSRSGLYVLRKTYPPTVFIELGNIKNPRDRPRFILPNNRQALANWIAEGILADYSAARQE